MKNLNKYLEIKDDVKEAIELGRPVVALESTIIAHGMPYPQNIDTALEIEKIIKDNGAVPATIGIIEGKIKVGLTKEEVEFLGESDEVVKVSRRDLPVVLAEKRHGATTVAGTMIAADLAGIKPETNKPVEGVSLEPLLFRNDKSWNSRLLYSFWGGRASVRSQQYRLDGEGRLFDINKDRGQYIDVSGKNPQVASRLQDSLERWKKEMTAEIDRESRPFPIGHPDFPYTQMPARDGEAHGNIERSNRFPNCTFFTNWTSSSDKITWDAEVLSEGEYRVELYYTCSRQNLGSTIELSMGSAQITGKITEAHDPPLRGMEDDRSKRMESYVKAFMPMELGTIHLEEGRGTLTLEALNITGEEAMDFRLLMFERIE